MDKYKVFREMHKKSNMLLLPNAWNGGSARVYEKEGYKAVGTTSAGIAYSLGFSDGEKLDFDTIHCVVGNIIRRVNIPVSVDMERGYGDDIDTIKSNISRMLASGAVGFNIEDGIIDRRDIDDTNSFCNKIRSIAELKKSTNIDFFINARTDIYLLSLYDNDKRFSETVKRAKQAKEAGADGIFIPGNMDYDTISALRESIDMPINLYIHPNYTDFEILRQIGINRVSSGSAVVRDVYSTLIEDAKDFAEHRIGNILSNNLTYNKANEYFNNCKK